MSNLQSRLSAPRIVRHSDELLNVIRDRLVELGTTHNSVETESGLQLGYLTKVISNSPPKRMGAYIMFLICETLGLQLSVSIAPDFEKRMAHRLEQRRLSRKHVFKKAGKKLTPDVLIHRSRLGGQARAKKLSAERLSEIGRNAINARWCRVREARTTVTS